MKAAQAHQARLRRGGELHKSDIGHFNVMTFETPLVSRNSLTMRP